VGQAVAGIDLNHVTNTQGRHTKGQQSTTQQFASMLVVLAGGGQRFYSKKTFAVAGRLILEIMPG
jgi:hypothetical protein